MLEHSFYFFFLMLYSQYSILNLLLKCLIHLNFQGSLLCSHLVGSVSFIFLLFLRCTWKKITMRAIRYFVTIEFWNFSEFPFKIPIFNISSFQRRTSLFTGYDKKFSQNDKNINNYKTIKLTKNVTENCYASYN